MDLATIIGIVACLIFIILSIALGQDGIAGVKYFIDYPSIMITFGGAFACLLSSCTIKEFVNGLKSAGIAFKLPSLNAAGIIQKIIDLSNVARKEGLLSLEEAAGELDDPFLQKGIMLIVDGTDPDLVRAIMETELVSIDDRHKVNVNFWETAGAMGPAWGMIGTLLGLVMMLYHMEDASTIGPSRHSTVPFLPTGSVRRLRRNSRRSTTRRCRSKRSSSRVCFRSRPVRTRVL